MPATAPTSPASRRWPTPGRSWAWIVSDSMCSAAPARVQTVAALAEAGCADRMVLSHGASCFIDWFGPEAAELQRVLMPNWTFEHISNDVLPALRASGVTDAQIDQMLVEVPHRYFGG